MSKPIVVETTKATAGFPKGAELGFDTEAKAAKILGDDAFKVVRFQDGSVYEAPKKATAKADAKDKDA